MPGVDHPWVLLLLAACLPAFLGKGVRLNGFASVAGIPRDPVSEALDWMLRAIEMIALAAMVLGIAGLHDGPRSVERTGTGAHVVVVLDRSLSMDEPFALRGEKATESKSVAASRLLDSFFARRPHDSFGVVAFSTSPIPAMPLTAHREAVAASIEAMSRPGLANTDIGAGIALGLAQFDRDPPGAARVLVLVSDGAGAIDEATRAYIRAAQSRSGAHLYYLYLRSGDDPPLAEDVDESHNLERPAGLDTFFRSLGAFYQGFEARDAGAVAAATQRIAALETRQITYSESVKRRDLDGFCFAVAAICLCLSLLAQLAERGLLPARAHL
jgi:mxaC protein